MFASSSTFLLLASATLVPLVSAHGGIISHFIREAGDKSLEVCGQDFNNDRTGVRDGNNVFGQILDHSIITGEKWKDPVNCNWRLCSGLQYEDNVANTYYYPIGAIVPINVFILNRHAGVANVSIVDTKTNEVVGTPLIEWNDGKYAQYDNVNTCPNGPPVEETAFNVTIPDLGDKCTKGGDCVVQWYWYSESANNQTFNSCIDFVQPFGGSALPAMVDGRPDIFEHKAYCHPADQTTTTVYDTATLLNEASSPKTLVSLGGDAAALPTLTTAPVESPSATVTSAASSAAISEVASASASPSPSSASVTVQNLIASDSPSSEPTSTAETYADAAPTTITLDAVTTSTIIEEEAAPTTTSYAEEEATTTVVAEEVSATTTANSGAVVVQTPAADAAVTACATQQAVNAAAAETVTINETVTITATPAPLATTTVIEKVYVFMEAISTSTADIVAAATSTPVKRRHASKAKRLSSHH